MGYNDSDLQVLFDEREISRTLSQYALALDYDQQPDRFGDCFTEDGVWHSSAEGQWAGLEGLELRGRSEIESWFRRRVATRGPSASQTKHMFRQPHIEIDGSRAKVESHFLVLHEDADGPRVYAMGWYRDRFERCDDGRWRIAERLLGRENVLPSHQNARVG